MGSFLEYDEVYRGLTSVVDTSFVEPYLGDAISLFEPYFDDEISLADPYFIGDIFLEVSSFIGSLSSLLVDGVVVAYLLVYVGTGSFLIGTLRYVPDDKE